MESRTRLGDLQFAIMQILWEKGEATVAAVHESLRDERGLALTTIATMLRKMEQKGVGRSPRERPHLRLPTAGSAARSADAPWSAT